MNQKSVAHCISLELLKFIRDSAPTETELLCWLGDNQQSRYYILQKAGVLILNEGVVQLAPQNISSDKKRFWWGNILYHLDDKKMDVF